MSPRPLEYSAFRESIQSNPDPPADREPVLSYLRTVRRPVSLRHPAGPMIAGAPEPVVVVRVRRVVVVPVRAAQVVVVVVPTTPAQDPIRARSLRTGPHHRLTPSGSFWFLDPASQKPADLNHLAGGIFILPDREELQLDAGPDVSPENLE